jgi:hypothetical protein
MAFDLSPKSKTIESDQKKQLAILLFAFFAGCKRGQLAVNFNDPEGMAGLGNLPA